MEHAGLKRWSTNTISSSQRALVLNASYEPLGVVASRRALMLILQNKAEMLHSTGQKYHSARSEFEEPSVVRLNYYVKVPYSLKLSINRRAIFLRDGFKCQYCGGPAESVDHVIPKARGGQHIWENVVAACRKCNFKKKDRLLNEVGMKLARKPIEPRDRLWMIKISSGVNSLWEPYLNADSLSA